MTILKPIMAGLLISTASATYAEQVTVSAVEVAAELADVNNKKALEYYPNVQVDLQAALTDQLAPLVGDDGHTVTVRIDEISLDGQPLREDQGFNTLTGFVYVLPPTEAQSDSDQEPADTAAVETFNIQLTATSLGAGLQPGSDDYYRAMVLAFAQSAAEKVAAVDVVNP